MPESATTSNLVTAEQAVEIAIDACNQSAIDQAEQCIDFVIKMSASRKWSVTFRWDQFPQSMNGFEQRVLCDRFRARGFDVLPAKSFRPDGSPSELEIGWWKPVPRTLVVVSSPMAPGHQSGG